MRSTAGQPVMTLEAMKMEHVHTAGIAGTVAAIDVAEGEQVTTGKVVVEIAAESKLSSSRPPSRDHAVSYRFEQCGGCLLSQLRPGVMGPSVRRDDEGLSLRRDLPLPSGPVIQPARDLVFWATVGQHRPLDLAALHRVAAAGVESAAGGWVDRAWHVAVDHGRNTLCLGICDRHRGQQGLRIGMKSVHATCT